MKRGKFAFAAMLILAGCGPGDMNVRDPYRSCPSGERYSRQSMEPRGSYDEVRRDEGCGESCRWRRTEQPFPYPRGDADRCRTGCESGCRRLAPESSESMFPPFD